MKFHSMAEWWSFDDGPQFLYTQVIYHDGNHYFSAKTPERVTNPEDIPVLDQEPTSFEKIPNEHIWPLYESHLTICPNPDRPDVYVKQPRLTSYTGSDELGLYLVQEARICQTLIENPHQNLARYLGCVVEAGRITGLCFERYTETLAERLQNTRWRSENNDSFLRQVKAGIDYLHTLNLVHNDIHSDNVMFADQSDVPVIIDFDSCASRGCPLPSKRGKLPEGAQTAEFENDDFALELLRRESYEMMC
ncbi:uncharacterized protein N7500_009190 [Penicillium coprophilum]|uniref:uncharacterized protein n=1 Tax=Penicillium coprophilum TaxID=36646 RepID=UPI0023A1301B|nr:uncharacterized protein N7500_009190 [Penicillium coprophilum]KAJ5153751.1 hypothetical protein N7500_009190 [Penicillium coprophilum]